MAFAIDDLSNVIAHWSADQIGGLSDGDPVTTFPDSISSWSLSGSGTTRPLYRPTGINSLPSIEFDGTDDYLESASKSLTASRVMVCFVAKVTNKNYNAFLYLSTSSGTPTFINPASRVGCYTYSTGQASITTGDGSGNSNWLVNALIPNTTKFMLTSWHNRLTSGVRLNGLDYRITGGAGYPRSTNLSATTVYANLGRCSLGGGFTQGHVSEIVLWSESELCESWYIEGVLAHKFGITLPTSHPFYAAAPTSAPGSGGAVFDPLGRGALVI